MRLEKDVYRGNEEYGGKAGLTERMRALEEKFDYYNDLLPKMRDFLSMQEWRATEAKNAWWKTALGAGIILFFFNMLWSIIKSKIGLS
jgi:hypothetical protein